MRTRPPPVNCAASRSPGKGLRRARQVQDPVDGSLDLEPLGDVLLGHRETRPTHEVRDVVRRAGDEVVDAHDVRVQVHEPLAQPGADEAGPAGDHDAPLGHNTQIGSHRRSVP